MFSIFQFQNFQYVRETDSTACMDHGVAPEKRGQESRGRFLGGFFDLIIQQYRKRPLP
jgi:hypothetical protein